MGMYTTLNTASSGLTAQRTRLDVIANNLANIDTTAAGITAVLEKPFSSQVPGKSNR
jgi:flagellar basal body rod protein FlgC